jgi:hypothetical protein
VDGFGDKCAFRWIGLWNPESTVATPYRKAKGMPRKPRKGNDRFLAAVLLICVCLWAVATVVVRIGLIDTPS